MGLGFGNRDGASPQGENPELAGVRVMSNGFLPAFLAKWKRMRDRYLADPGEHGVNHARLVKLWKRFGGRCHLCGGRVPHPRGSRYRRRWPGHSFAGIQMTEAARPVTRQRLATLRAHE
jgi:hypothetical protein